jgi:hypothetical protein
MGERYLIDSNVLIDYTSNKLPESSNEFLENLFDSDFNISVITQIEVLGYDELPHKIKLLEDFLATAFTFDLNMEITKRTVLLRRHIKKIKLGDDIIAATAISNNLTIITRNSKDFEKIIELKTINPYDL